jgi:hypothetical protein
VYAVSFGTLCNRASFLREFLTEESLMAREPEKSAREIGKAKSETTAGSKNAGNDEAGEAKSGKSDTTELLKAQHQELQAILAKRSECDRRSS